MAVNIDQIIANAKASKTLSYSERDKNTFDNSKQVAYQAIEKAKLEKTIGADTFESDLRNLEAKVKGIYNSWQNPTMLNDTRSSIENMQKRIGAYQTYRQKYGNGAGVDLSELSKGYETVLGDWDSITEYFSGFENEESYNTMVQWLKNVEDNRSVDIANLEKEIAQLEIQLKPLQEEVNSKRSANNIKHRDGGLALSRHNERYGYKYNPETGRTENANGKTAEEISSEAEEIKKLIEQKKSSFNQAKYAQNYIYLTENDVSLEDLAAHLKDEDPVAYTTPSGQSVTWQALYDDKEYNVGIDALYEKYSSKEDWKDKSTYTPKLSKENWNFRELSESEQILEYVYGSDSVRKQIVNDRYIKWCRENGVSIENNSNMELALDYGHTEGYDIFNDKEKEIFTYLQQSEKVTAAELEAFREYTRQNLLKRHDENEVDKMYKEAQRNPILGTIKSVPYGFAGGFEYVTDLLSGDYSGNHLSAMASALRQGVSDTVNWEIAGWDAFDFLYNTGMSMADTIVATTVFGPYGGAGMLALSAAASATNSALDRGLSGSDAFWNGFFSGLFEGVFEYVSIGNLKALKTSLGDGSFKTFAKNLAKSMGVNASEETLTELANIAYDTFVNADFSQYETLVRQYVAQGMSQKEAESKAKGDLRNQVFEAMASGTLMGFGFGTYGGIASNINAKAVLNTYDSDSINALIDEGLSAPGSDAYKLALQYRQKLNSGKSLNAQEIVDLVNANEKAFTESDRNKITAAVAKRLAQLGEKNNISKLAKAITKTAIGQRTTLSEENLIKESKYGQRVANELNTENISSGNYSSSWAQNIGTERINAQAYNQQSAILDKNSAGNYNNIKGDEADVFAGGDMESGTTVQTDGRGEANYYRSNRETSESFARRTSENPRGVSKEGTIEADFSESAISMPEGGKNRKRIEDYVEDFDDDADVFTEPPKKEIARERTREQKLEETMGNHHSDEMIQVEEIAKKLGVNIRWSYKVNRGLYIPKSKTIVLNPRTTLTQLYIEVFKHEFAHFLESKKAFAEFKDYLFSKSIAFEEFLRKELKTEVGSREELIEKGRERYFSEYSQSTELTKKQRDEFTKEDAEFEMVADFVGKKLFKGVSSESLDLLQKLATHKPTIIERLREWIKSILSRLKGDPHFKTLEQDFSYLDKRLAAVYNSATKNTADEGGVKYYAVREDVRSWDIPWDDDNGSSLKEQLKKHLEEINNMEPVADVIYNKHSSKPYYVVLDELLKQNFGYKIQRKEYGTIVFGPDDINKARNYVNNDAEAAALISAPYVLKRGKAISGHKNHKGKGSVTVTFAAPVYLNGEIGNVGVCVQYGKGNIHSVRVLTPMGETFELLKTKDTETTITGRSSRATVDPYIASVSNNNIHEIKSESNTKFSDKDFVDIYTSNSNENTSHVFAGESSQSADKMKLKTAEKLEREGKDKDYIRRETGWYRGDDGKWRFEISDKDCRFKNVYVTGGTTLGHIFKHDALFKAYPELKNISVVLERGVFMGLADASYSPERNQILVSLELLTDEKTKAEIEKLQQTEEYEDFSMARSFGLKEGLKIKNFWSTKVGQKYLELTEKAYRGKIVDSVEARKAIIHEIQHAVQEIEEFSEGYNPWAMIRAGYPVEESFENYKNSAGEREADDSAARLLYDDAERVKTPPDVGRDGVVFAEDLLKKLEPSAKAPAYNMMENFMYESNGLTRYSEDQKLIRRIGKALGWTIEFSDVRTKNGAKADGRIDRKRRIITISTYNEQPIHFILKHELTHFGESSKYYNSFVKAVRRSDVYKEWLSARTGMSDDVDLMETEAINQIIENRKGKEDLTLDSALYELIANFAGDNLFGGSDAMQQILSGVTGKQRNAILQFIIDFFEHICEKLSGHSELTFELRRLQSGYIRLLNDAKASQPAVYSSPSRGFAQAKLNEKVMEDMYGKEGYRPERNTSDTDMGRPTDQYSVARPTGVFDGAEAGADGSRRLERRIVNGAELEVVAEESYTEEMRSLAEQNRQNGYETFYTVSNEPSSVKGNTVIIPIDAVSQNIYSFDRGVASFTEQRLNSLFDNNISGGDMVAYISPADFLKLTSSEANMQNIRSETGVLRPDDLKGEQETPFLTVNAQTGEVVGHEGRHRMSALQNSGIEKVAFVIKAAEGTSFGDGAASNLQLTGQQFAMSRADATVMLEESLPLTEQYRSEIEAKFLNNDADISYSFANEFINTRTTIDKYGYSADNISRANKQGEFINDYYYALTKSEWTTFYDEITNKGYLATAIVGTVAPISVNDKLIIAERQYTGKDAHDYVVIDAFKVEETYDIDWLDEVIKAIDEGDLIYDKQTMYQNLSRILKRNQSTGVLTRFDADSQRYVRGYTQRINGKGNEGVYTDSQKGIAGEGISLRDKSSIQRGNGLQQNSERDTLGKTLTEEQQVVKRSLALKDSKETISKNSDRLAGKLIRQNRSSADQTFVSEQIQTIIESVADNKWGPAMSAALRAADAIVDSSRFSEQLSEEAVELLNEIRNTSVSLNSKQKAEVAYIYGSYNDYRKQNIGRLNLKNGATPLDIKWQEWSEAYPHLFDEGLSDADMPAALANIVESLRSQFETYDTESARQFVAEQIFTEAVNTGGKPQSAIDRVVAELQEKHDTEITDYEKRLKQKEKRIIRQSEQLKRRRSELQKEETARRDERADKQKNVEHIRRIVGSIDKKLRANNDKNPVPQELQEAVKYFCNIFLQNDQSVFNKKDMALVSMAYSEYSGTAATGGEGLLGTYDLDIDQSLRDLCKTLHGKTLRQLSNFELQVVRDIVDNFNHIIVNENKLFLEGRRADIAEIGENAYADIKEYKTKKIIGPTEKATQMLLTNNITPIYFFERLGPTFSKLYDGVRDGQDKWFVNMETAKTFIRETKEKYHYSDWDNDTFIFTTQNGDRIELTREQAMLLYATDKRERTNTAQKAEHLFRGGIVLDYESNAKSALQKMRKSDKDGIKKAIDAFVRDVDSKAHQITPLDIGYVNEWLTDEQKAYADAMVEYLSTDMAALGNETSMQLFGIRKYNEKYYIPYNSARNYLFSQPGVNNSEQRLKHQSFTRQTQRKANNPLLLSDFSTVCADHINRMCMYNALTVPLENLNRIFNYSKKGEEGVAAFDIKAEIERAFGSGAVQYFKQFLEDVNGTVRTSNLDTSLGRWIGKFKKGAVFFSASVAIQQPSAVARAFAMVNPKYFATTTLKTSERDYQELVKYAPVAGIKAMGRFDTGVGVENTTWLLQEEYIGIGNKAKALITDSEYRDDKLSYFAAKADELTWAHIWAAVKAETKDTTDLIPESEEFLIFAGKRFRDVIDHTQVYDSTLSRSQNMRDKSAASKMLTAFMAESTVSLNLLMDGIRRAKGKGNKKIFVRAGSAWVASVALNAILKALVTAARDDDELTSYTEKYFENVFENFKDDINILRLVPFVKDVVSIFEGWDVGRADMSLFSDLYAAINALDSADKTLDEKLSGLANSFAAFFGIPLKNATRDLRAAQNVVDEIINGPGAGSQYMDALEQSDTYKSLNSEEKKKVASDLKSSIKKEKEVKSVSYDIELYDRLFLMKLRGSENYSKMKKKLIAEGVSENTIKDRLEIAKIAFLRERGVDVHEYILSKLMTSEAKADLDSSGSVSIKEKKIAINRMDLSQSEKSALISVLS